MNANRRSQFGTMLRQFREAAGFSQEQLAEHAGLSLRGISDLERGLLTTPRLETVRMLAEGLSLDEVQRTELLAARNSSNAPRLFRSVQQLSTLPAPTSSFIGRGEEITAIAGIVEQDHARLVTLTGPGGVGKTRVAIEVARRLAGSFAAGAVFVELSAIRTPDLVLPAIADQLGIPGQGEREIKDVLVVALQNRSMLMVLDNLEQVIDAATDIAWLLAVCPDLTILATSRILLRLAAEQVVPVEPLALPTYHDVYSLQRVDAVALFVARAHAVDRQFTLDQGNASTIATIVNRLQGMPLAIELAAARLRLLSVSELLKRLDSQLPVLAGGARDAPDRHRTMRETIAWSYDLLSPMEQVVFRTLAIFPDGCTLATAVAVLGVDHRLDEAGTTAAVESLVDSSMLRRREGSDGQTRYRMLQTLQEFGLEQLVAAGEETMDRQAAHDAWCVPLARESEFVRSRPDARSWLPSMEAELQNVRTHIAWLIKHNFAEEALDISGSLAAFREIRGFLNEGRLELELLLAHPQNQAATVTRMRGLIGMGVLSALQGESIQSVDVLREGVELARELGDRWYLSRALQALALAKSHAGQLDEAEALTRESLAIARELDDGFLVSGGTGNLGLVFAMRGDLDQAYELAIESLTLSLAFGNPWRVALSKLHLGSLSLRRGKLIQAEALIYEAERLFIELDDPRDLPAVYLYLADIARLREDLSSAEHWLEQARATASDIGSISDIGHSYIGLAQVARLRGDLATSRTMMCSAIQWFERGGTAVGVERWLDQCADLAFGIGDAQRAAWCIGALDGVLAGRGRSHLELTPGEHRARVLAVMSLLDNEAWTLHYGRGCSMSPDEVLAELKSWLPCRISDERRVAPSGQTTQNDYDGGTC